MAERVRIAAALMPQVEPNVSQMRAQVIGLGALSPQSDGMEGTGSAQDMLTVHTSPVLHKREGRLGNLPRHLPGLYRPEIIITCFSWEYSSMDCADRTLP